MPSVDIELGITVPFPDNTYANVRPTIRFSGIDPNGDIDEQVRVCTEAVAKIIPNAEEVLVQEASNLTSMNFEGIGVAAAFAAFEKYASEQLDAIIKEMKRQKKVVDEIAPKGKKGK